MREKFNRRGFAAVPFLLSLIFIIGLSSVKAATLYGVTATNQLVRFDSATPSTLTNTVAITGLQTGENILGIDFRPATGQLFGLGSTSRLYTINLTTGAATAVGAAGAFTLSGTSFGFDFNPVPDRIRVVSDTGQNLRLNPIDGTLAATDTNLNPATTGVTAAAYTNSFAGTTATTLYVIDTNSDTLYIQNPPNNGTLVAVGALGVDASAATGFDIARGSNQAFAALNVGGVTNLYRINLTTGAATSVGAVAASAGSLSGLAVSFDNTALSTGRGTAYDYDGDFRHDYSIFRPGENTWYVANSSANNGTFNIVRFGLQEDFQTPGDYDGDGRADITVWRPSNGVFYSLRSSDGTVQFTKFGQQGDEPVSWDYDGDGRTDYAIVRRTDDANGINGSMTWYILNSSTNNSTFRAERFGFATDVVAPGDYDGDGRFDIAVYRGEPTGQATFFVNRSRDGFTTQQFGIGSDLVVPGDYDGDGRTDFAVLRTGTPYTWYVLRSSDNTASITQFGTMPQFSVQADYDGDGRTDIAVWDAQSGVFYVLRTSTGNVSEFKFGQRGDIPVDNFNTH